MLDFSDKIYKKIYDFAVKTNLVACCREYPALAWNRKKIIFQTIQDNLKRNFTNPSMPCGLYVHFPYCKSRCTFCKYYSDFVHDTNIFDNYLDALEKEIKFYRINFSKVTLDNVFLGGGTPTLLDVKQIKRYMGIIYKFFKVDKKTQITIEGTPETVKSDTLKAWKDMGVNRISLGVQSFNDQVLKITARTNNVTDIFKAFGIIKKVKIKFTGIDLMWGLPNENRETYEKTIKDTLRLSPDFIECYLLTPGRRVKIKSCLPSDITIDEAVQLFKEGFLNNGYRLYFSGNFFGFIKKGVNRLDAMNRNTEGVYNYRSSCLGIGAGSSSVFPNIKYNIISRTRVYIENLLVRNKPPIYYGFPVNKQDFKRQYVISQFGFYRILNKEEYYKIFKTYIENDFSKEITLSKKNGIVTETKNNLIWHFNEHKMGHKDFFWYTVRYWYHPNYIKEVIKEYNL